MENNEKKHRYEDDLWDFINIRNKNSRPYKKFGLKYEEFLKAAEIKENKIEYYTSAGLISYFIKNKQDICFLFDSINDSGISFSFDEINILLKEFAPRVNINSNIYKKIKNSKDIITCADELLKERDINALTLYFYVLKYKLVYYAEILKSVMNYMESAYEPFLKYYNLILSRKQVPHDLVDKIIELMMHSTFATINDNISFSDNFFENNKTFLNYTKDFIEYTKAHNEGLNKNKEIKFEAPKKEENKVDLSKTLIKSEPITKENTIDKEEKNDENEMIKNYVDSYFEILCSYNTSDVHNYLPNPSIPEYEKIMVALLQKYEEYLNEEALKNNNTMDKMNIYLMLEDCVNNIKS